MARIIGVLRASFAKQSIQLEAVTESAIDPSETVRAASDREVDRPIAELWLDLRSRPATLFLVAAGRPLVYARRLAVQSNPDAVETELIRFIIDRSVNALLNGQAEGVSVEQFKRSWLPPRTRDARPSPPPSLKPKSRVRRNAVTFGFGVSALGPNANPIGPQIGFERREPLLHLRLTLAQALPVTVARGDVSLHLLASDLRLVAARPVALSSNLLATLGVGIGGELTRVSARGPGSRPAFWARDPMLVGIGTLEYAWSEIVLMLQLGVDASLVGARYWVSNGQASGTFWAPSRFRPTAALGLSYVF